MNIPGDVWHKRLGVATVAALTVYSYLGFHWQGSVETGLMMIGFMFGLYLFNPDTFTPSKSQQKWKGGKVVFQNKFWRFTHHGICHNPIFWIALTWLAQQVIAYQHYEPLAIFFIVGIAINALSHIVFDIVHNARQFFSFGI